MLTISFFAILDIIVNRPFKDSFVMKNYACWTVGFTISMIIFAIYLETDNL